MERPATYRFGVFRFDAGRLELQRDGRSVRLQRQPAQVLALLVERAGQLVTRDELRHAVWGDDTFVDFDRGLNFCIAQIRTALGDDAGTPRYVRTTPKKGYEFICPVSADAAPVGIVAQPTHATRIRSTRTLALAALGAAAVVGAFATAIVMHVGSSRRPIVAVARFDNETGDPALTRFSDALTDNLVEQLTLAGAGARYDVIGNAAILRTAREGRDLQAIGTALHASYVVIGQLQGDSSHLRVLGHLIRLPDQTHVTVSRFDDVADQTLERTQEIAARMGETFARRLVQHAPHASPSAATDRESKAWRLMSFWL